MKTGSEPNPMKFDKIKFFAKIHLFLTKNDENSEKNNFEKFRVFCMFSKPLKNSVNFVYFFGAPPTFLLGEALEKNPKNPEMGSPKKQRFLSKIKPEIKILFLCTLFLCPKKVFF